MLISYKKPRGRFFVVGGKAQPVVEWTVTVTAGANGSVSVDGVPGDYLETVPGGTVLTIEAEADTDYEFTQWSDGNTDNPRTLTVDSDISLSASFQEAAPQFKHFYVEDTSGNDNTLSITDSTQSNPTEVFKSTDRVSWTSMGTTSSTPITATVPANGRLYLKASTSAMDRNRMTCSSDYKVGGQAASLLFGDNYINSALGPTNNGAFRDLFYMSATLTDASDLVLPGTVSEYCYNYMFYGCTSLTAAPTLSATTLAQNCYNGMFNGCSSLAAAPALPATTMAQGCYSSMFKDCTSLTAAPTLPAATLAQDCYYAMFNGCTGIATAPALPATTLAQGCYYTMFAGCTSLTTAPTLPATTLADSCYRNMFGRCSSLTAAPALPVTTLANLCYYAMFNGCTSLAAAPALPATTLLDNCYAYMFQGCTSLTTAPTLPAATLVQSCYTHMFQNCTSLNNVTTYADDISASLCLDDWLDNVAATGTFNNLGSAVYPSGASGIPSGWTPPQPNNEIWYTSTDNSVVSSYAVTNSSGNALTETSNTVVNGKGVIRFSGTVAKLANSFSSQTKLRTITLPSTVTQIGNSCFGGCTSLTDIDMGGSVATIGAGSFNGSVPLSRIEIPQSVTSIGTQAFSTPLYTGTVYFNALNCTSMGSSSYPVFYKNKMTAVEIGVGVTYIPSNAFKKYGRSEYKTLASITFNDTQAVPTIGADAFQYCADTGTVYGQPGLDYSAVMAALPSGWTLVQ